jgi:hypothetical protein
MKQSFLYPASPEGEFTVLPVSLSVCLSFRLSQAS